MISKEELNQIMEQDLLMLITKSGDEFSLLWNPDLINEPNLNIKNEN